ncbi:MAG: MarR family transcriptional regulator [Actinobacteria bacterium]|nr:MarR family transcriptional regulator [Actinomycetota bacterium]
MATVDERTLAARLRLAVVRLNRRLRAQHSIHQSAAGQSGFAAHPATLTQLSALSTLYEHGPMTPGELAARERVQPPSMTRVIAALEDAGFVTRTPHPTDGRQTVIAVTDAGTAYVEAEVSARERWLDARLDELSDDERALLCRAAEIIDRMAGA